MMPLKRVLCICLVLLVIVGPVPTLRPALAQSPRGLDLVLLIDSSGSMAKTDPGNLRVSAASFLIDYVQAVGEAQGITHRFAVANFNTHVLDTQPLQPLLGSATKDNLTPRNEGDTDFVPAFGFARQQLAPSPDKKNPMAVVLFTDGEPAPITSTLEAYFQALLPQVRSLQETGVRVFVVAIGDAVKNQAQWTQPGMIPANRYRTVDKTTDLAGMYHEFLFDLLGLQKARDQTLDDNAELTVKLQPYLEQAVFSVIKDKPGAEVKLYDPSNALVPSSRSGDLHLIYAVAAPTAGAWRIQSKGGKAQVWVDQRLPTLALDAPSGPQAVGKSIDLVGRLVLGGQTIVDNNLTLQLASVSPRSNEPIRKDMERQTDGRYLTPFSLDAAGTFSWTLNARLAGESLLAQTVPLTLTAYSVPSVTSPNVEGDKLVSRSVTVTAKIVNPEKVGSQAFVRVRVRDAGSQLIGATDLHDDGQAPDTQAKDGLFSGLVTLPPVAGKYGFEFTVEGRTIDGVAVEAPSQWVQVDVLATVPVATLTPTPSATPRPTPQPYDFPPTLKRYEWWVMGLAIGLVALTVFAMYAVPRLREAKRQRDQFSRKLETAERESAGLRTENVGLQKDNDLLRADHDRYLRLLERAEEDKKKAEQEQVKAENERNHHEEQSKQWWGEREEYRAQAEKAASDLNVAQQEIEDLKKQVPWLQKFDRKFKEAETTRRKDIDKANRMYFDCINIAKGAAEATEQMTFKKTRELFIDWLPPLRAKKPAEYKKTVQELAHDTQPAILRALAYGLLIEVDESQGESGRKDRNSQDTMAELYDVLAQGGDVRLLDAVAEARSHELATVSEAISIASHYPTVSALKDVINDAELLHDAGKGLKATYQLLANLAESPPLTAGLEEDWQTAIESTRKAGPARLHDLLKKAEEIFRLPPGERNGQWYRKTLNQLRDGESALRKMKEGYVQQYP